jgi:hypothetical protein
VDEAGGEMGDWAVAESGRSDVYVQEVSPSEAATPGMVILLAPAANADPFEERPV